MVTVFGTFTYECSCCWVIRALVCPLRCAPDGARMSVGSRRVSHSCTITRRLIFVSSPRTSSSSQTRYECAGAYACVCNVLRVIFFRWSQMRAPRRRSWAWKTRQRRWRLSWDPAHTDCWSRRRLTSRRATVCPGSRLACARECEVGSRDVLLWMSSLDCARIIFVAM